MKPNFKEMQQTAIATIHDGYQNEDGLFGKYVRQFDKRQVIELTKEFQELIDDVSLDNARSYVSHQNSRYNMEKSNLLKEKQEAMNSRPMTMDYSLYPVPKKPYDYGKPSSYTGTAAQWAKIMEGQCNY